MNNDTNNSDTAVKKRAKSSFASVRWMLVIYDFLCFLCVGALLLLFSGDYRVLELKDIVIHGIVSVICVFGSRFVFKIYSQIWRYGGVQPYIRLIGADAVGFVLYCICVLILPVSNSGFDSLVAVCCANLLGSLTMRMLYRYAYKCNGQNLLGRVLCKLVYCFTGRAVDVTTSGAVSKIKIAIVGAGRVGVSLAEELLNNSASAYLPICFVDIKSDKIGRTIHGLPVLSEKDRIFDLLRSYGVQEIVFAMPHMDVSGKKALYDYYKQSGCKIKVYDYPVMQSATNQKRSLRQFDIEELLFRKPKMITDAATKAYYKGKVILITGGGGSIGSELCRQIAKLEPKQLIILDVYENGAYDVQQELKMAYGNRLDLRVEIISVCNRAALEKIFDTYRPNIVLNAAAHKHVPLMEHNCCEAVENNVFGTLNTVEAAIKYGAQRFIMISTDKAVNPTNVMGATKRMCEMIVRAYSQSSCDTVFSATRFGNVLGSAGSVVPLFRRQIAAGGPVTITDKRIIRYFMTIPEASQLVLQSGAMAKDGELFVLDMGKPVKIVKLAEDMIRLSGFEPYRDIDIVEIGLRPGEKLYEELLIKDEKLSKTENAMIFIEKDTALPLDELTQKLDALRRAVDTGDDSAVKTALHDVVPTFLTPDQINKTASKSEEMTMV